MGYQKIHPPLEHCLTANLLRRLKFEQYNYVDGLKALIHPQHSKDQDVEDLEELNIDNVFFDYEAFIHVKKLHAVKTKRNKMT